MVRGLRAEGKQGHSSFGREGDTAGISEKIRKWAQKNAWYETGVTTNQLRLQRAFGEIVEGVARDLKFHHQYLQRRQLYTCWDHLGGICRQIDMACRSGCRSEEELLELEFLRGRAIGAVAELAEVLNLMQKKPECTAPPPQPQTHQKNGWITVTEAAEILEVTKSTVSKWLKEGMIEDNAMRRRRRRLNRVSVLLLKQEREDSSLRTDLRDLREDVKRIHNR